MDPSAASNHRSRASLESLASGELARAGTSGLSGVTPVTCPAAGGNERAPRPTCPAERGKDKPPRAGSSKVKPPPALRLRGDPDGTKEAKLDAARRLYDDPTSRRAVCAMQRAGTPNVHLRLKPVASHPCTPTECHCVMDYDVIASQLGYFARYGDDPLRSDAAYVSNTVRGARRALCSALSAAAAAAAAGPESSRPALAPMDVNAASPQRSSPKRKTPEQSKKTPRSEEAGASGSPGKRVRSSDLAYPRVRLVSAFTDDHSPDDRSP